jgi:hypothetical protein
VNEQGKLGAGAGDGGGGRSATLSSWCEASWASGRAVVSSYPGGGNGKQRDMARAPRARDHPPPPLLSTSRLLLLWLLLVVVGAGADASLDLRQGPPQPCPPTYHPRPPPESWGSGPRIGVRAAGIRARGGSRRPQSNQGLARYRSPLPPWFLFFFVQLTTRSSFDSEGGSRVGLRRRRKKIGVGEEEGRKGGVNRTEATGDANI